MENWIPIGDRNMRREVWPCSQIKCQPEDIKAIGPLGSMIAIVSKEVGSLQAEEENVKCVLRIYNGSCSLVTSVKWYVRFENIIAIQWTNGLELVSVFTNGCVRVYSAHGELLRSFYLHSYGGTNNSRMEASFIKYKIWSDGFLFVNMENQKMYIQRGFEVQNSWLVDLEDLALTITAVGVVPSVNWTEVIVIISTFQGTNYIKMDHLMKCTTVEHVQKYLMQINPCTYTHISASPYYYDLEDESGEEYSRSGSKDRRENYVHYVGMGNKEEGLLTSLSITNRGVKILWEIKIESFNDIYTLSEGVLAVTLSGLSNATKDASEEKKSDSSVNSPVNSKFEISEGEKKGKESKQRGNNIVRLIYKAIYNVNIHSYVIDILSDVGGGIRMFTSNNIEYIKLVTNESELALSNERCDVTNTLLKTYEMFKKGHEKSSECIYSIRNELKRASQICLEASKDQWDPEKSLLLIEFSIFSSSLVSPSANSENSSDDLRNPTEHGNDLRNPSGNKNYPENRNKKQKERMNGVDNENGMGMAIKEEEVDGVTDQEKTKEKEHIIIICYLRLSKDLANYKIYTNINQLMLFGLNRIISLLTNLKLYLLSIRICEFFRINPSMVLLGWITTRIKLGAHLTDSELFNLIMSRMEKYLGTVVSFSTVAQVVFKRGREVLALSFIEREKCPYKQFRVLIKWNELSRAAKVANECGDPNLINFIILKTTVKNDISNIITLSKDYNLIRNLFIQQLTLTSNEKVLQIFYERMNSIFEAGLNSIESYKNMVLKKDSVKEREGLKERNREEQAVKEMKYSLNYSNGYFGNKNTPDESFWYEAVNNEILLLEHQSELERTHESLKGVKLVGKSLMETIYELYKLNMNKEVEGLVNLFKLPVNQTRCTKIAALYESHNVQEVLNLVQDKQLTSIYIKGNKTYFHLLLQILVNLGANSHVDAIIQAMKPSQQNYWKNFINQHTNK